MDTPITITVGPNGESLTGEIHLSCLRNYNTRIDALIAVLTPFDELTLAEFTPMQQNLCESAIRSAYILLTIVGTMTELTKKVYDSLTYDQHVTLLDLMTELELKHTTAVVMATKLDTVMRVVSREDEAYDA